MHTKIKFTLLVSVVLSAQCTDVNVNNVTRNLYKKYNKPEHFVKLGRKRIEVLIKKINFFSKQSKKRLFIIQTVDQTTQQQGSKRF